MTNKTLSNDDAHRLIKDQAAEIEALRSQLADKRLTADFRQSIVHAAAAGAIAAPLSHSRLLKLVVQTAMRVVSAEAAALFILDEQAQELSFEIALGPHAAAVQHFRVPLGHGIAGLVAGTGQPLIVSDVERDPRHASEIARAAGYTPRSILCVPLLRNERVTGVLELLDKHHSSSFGPTDMETAALFAEQAAVAIEQSFAIRNISGILAEALSRLVGPPDAQLIGRQAENLVRRVEEMPFYQRSLELAGLVRDIAAAGEDEMRLCETILREFAKYLRSRPAASLAGMRPWT